MADPRFLLDSNICIYILADLEGPAAQRLGTESEGSVVTSAIAFAEVERGLLHAGKAERDAADALFAAVQILPFDLQAGRSYARMPFRRARFDWLIAAHALSLGLALVTSNAKDFTDIPDLKLENWAE